MRGLVALISISAANVAARMPALTGTLTLKVCSKMTGEGLPSPALATRRQPGHLL